MKRMKRLACVIAALGVLMMQPNPALARYSGTLRSDAPWTLEFTPEIINNGPFVVTITCVDSKGRSDTDFFKPQFPEQTFIPFSQANIPKGTRLVIIEVDFRGGAGQLRITQGTTMITEDACDFCTQPRTRFVFDVV